MLIYSNPRKEYTTNDWPYGRDRVTAKFVVEKDDKKGERVSRITQNPKTGGYNKPKKTTYSMKALIVDGSDNKTYIAELSQYGHISIMQSNLQYQEETLWPDNKRFADVKKLFEAAL